MSSDQGRAAERRRRMDELLADAEANVQRTRAAKAAPVADDARSGTRWGTMLGIFILLAISAVFLGSAATVARFSSPDYNDARERGTATIDHCERHGPITRKGFGFYNDCTATVAWDNGLKSQVTLGKPALVKDAKPGDTFKIGKNHGSRGSVGYSRPDVPSRGWLAWVAGLMGIVGTLPLLAVIYVAKTLVKNVLKRR